MESLGHPVLPHTDHRPHDHTYTYPARHPLHDGLQRADVGRLSWGSLIDYDGFIDDISIQFDSLGSYRMMLIPDTKDMHGFTGLSAIGLSLSKQY